MHDLVIKGAILVDGMGNPATKGEVAVSGGKIVAIGENVGEGQETVDPCLLYTSDAADE